MYFELLSAKPVDLKLQEHRLCALFKLSNFQIFFNGFPRKMNLFGSEYRAQLNFSFFSKRKWEILRKHPILLCLALALFIIFLSLLISRAFHSLERSADAKEKRKWFSFSKRFEIFIRFFLFLSLTAPTERLFDSFDWFCRWWRFDRVGKSRRPPCTS